MALVAGSLCRYSCKSSCGGTLHDYNVPQKTWSSVTAGCWVAMEALAMNLLNVYGIRVRIHLVSNDLHSFPLSDVKR